MSETPLAEATPDSLQVIFDKDPLKLTSEDLDLVVHELRAQRDRWKLAEKKSKPKADKLVTVASLDDLGL